MIDPADDADLAQVQGSGANLPAVRKNEDGIRTLEFMGEEFRISDKTGIMPLLKFTDAAELSTNDPRAYSAMYRLLKDTVYEGQPGCGECEDCKNGAELLCEDYDPGDWAKFERHSMEVKADAEDLLDFVGKVMEVIVGRPTQQSGGSSPGQRSSAAGSTRRSSGRRGAGSRR